MGESPDYRFTLANERTFLAWLRTSLALVAGGIGVVELVPEFGPGGARYIVGFALLALAFLVSVTSYLRWDRSERAIRLGRSLPPSTITPVLAYGLALIILLVAALLAVGR